MASRRMRRWDHEAATRLDEMETMVKGMKMAVQDHDYDVWCRTALDLTLLAGSILILAQEVMAFLPARRAS